MNSLGLVMIINQNIENRELYQLSYLKETKHSNMTLCDFIGLFSCL